MDFGLAKWAAAAPMLALSPLAAAAAETADAPRTISFDVAAGGTLAALCVAATAWLMGRNKAAAPKIKAEFTALREPPLGEDVARTYASKADLAALDAKVTTDIAALRLSISDNDRRAEERARGTHVRLDQLYKASQKTNRSLGMLTGMLVGGKCNIASFIDPDDEE